MKTRTWSERDALGAGAGAESAGPAKGRDDAAFDALLQAALAAGGEGGSEPTCTAGVPHWWTRGP
jgi:hypothetical protein